MYEDELINIEDPVFEWDNNKDRANFLKHGIHFRTAVKVFLDPDRIIRSDEEHTQEQRYDVIGMVDRLLFVVCAVYEGPTVRIISARLTTKREREKYDDYKNIR